MSYKLALFDFDGTLADSAEWFIQRLNELAAEFDLRQIRPEDQEMLRGYSSEQVIKYLGLPKWKLPLWVKRMREAAGNDHGAIKLFPGVPEMFAGLAQCGVQVGIVSSNSEENIRRILGRHTERVRYFSCGASLFGKAAKLRRVLKLSKTAASDAIYIGDEIRDATAARAAGMAFGAVSWGFASVEALRGNKPEVEFTTLGEIVRLVGSPSTTAG
ncbi:MAG TPA: HAD-IA family hydrolase [Verrucomicrobiae bacterium]